MKLEWGKKIYCPACALPFYDMRKTSLTCPNCGNQFDASDLSSRKRLSIAMDEIIDEENDKVASTTFGFSDESDTEFNDDSDELSVKSELDDIKLVDEQ